MQLASLGDERIEPTQTGQRAVCPGCGEEVLSKCGEIIAWHWAHIGGADCVASEGMTQWHKDWQDLTPKAWQEIIGRDIDGAVVHRADIRLPSGLIVEIQRSPISVADIESREDYWKRIVWIRHGEGLKLLINGQDPSEIQPHTWPNLKAKIAKRRQELRGKKRTVERISYSTPIDISQAKAKLISLANFLRSELKEVSATEKRLALGASICFEVRGIPIVLGVSSFAWKIKRPSWDAHTAPIWIDLPGSDCMALINSPDHLTSCIVAPRSIVQALLEQGIDISELKEQEIDIDCLLSKTKQAIKRKIAKQLERVTDSISLIEQKQREQIQAYRSACNAEQAKADRRKLAQSRLALQCEEAAMGRVLDLGGLSPRFVARWTSFFESCQSWQQIEAATKQIEAGVKLLLWRQLSPELKQRLRQIKQAQELTA